MSKTFENLTLKLGLINFWPLITISNDTDGKTKGLLYDLWVYVAQSIGLRWTEFKASHTEFDYKLFKYLQNKSDPNVDVIVMPIFAKESNHVESVIFSSPFDYSYTDLITNLRGQCEVTAYDELLPHITISTRLATFALILATSLVLYVNERTNGLINYFFTITTALIRQPLSINSSKVSARIATSFLLLGFFPLITTYLAEMNAHLVSCTEKVPDNIEDLLEMNKPSAISELSYDYSNLLNSPNAIAKTLAEKLMKSNGLLKTHTYNTLEIERIFLEEKRTLIMSHLPFLANLARECKKSEVNKEKLRRLTLRFGTTRYFMRGLCIPMKKDLPSELVDSINTRILFYKDVGLYEKGIRKIMHESLKCLGPNIFSESDKITLESIKLVDVASLFKLWAIGLSLSTAIFAFERLQGRYYV